jgi:hypothetical protein
VRYRTYFNFLWVYSLGQLFSFRRVKSAQNKERGAIVPQDVEWRLLAEEASQENNPKKLVEIVEALTRALDQQQHKEKAVSTSHTASHNSPASLP